MSEQQSQELSFANGPVLNYGALADYEPRIADPTGKGGGEAWGRGVPRYLVVYAIVTAPVVLVVSYLGPLQAVFDVFGTPIHLLVVGLLSIGTAGWLWAMPPGGVRAHQALPAMWRGLWIPRTLVGWSRVDVYPAGWAPGEVIVEPDFAGRWPATRVVGPARLVRTQAASKVVREGAGPGEVGLVLIAEPGPRKGGPTVMEVPAGHVIELRAQRAGEERS
ncbi:MAG: hypothetical protein REI11_22380 [Patulibacter sp.]|nr:hypothetical protein [Patulibacter sp.]